MELSIENLLPSKSSFKLNQCPGEEITLNPATAGALMEMQKKLGKIENLLGTPTAENLSKMAMFLMDPKDRSRFKKRKVTVIDEDGNESEIEIGGWQLIMTMICGIKEQNDIYCAVLISLGFTEEKAKELIQKLNDALNNMVKDGIKEIEKLESNEQQELEKKS